MDSLQRNSIEKALSEEELVQQLKALGIREGMVLEVHSSLKAIGYVIGGAQSVVNALQQAVGYDGTLVMPIQSRENTEPSYWIDPPASRDLWEKIRNTTPGFNADASEFPLMGAVGQNLNRRPGAYQSYHPNCAFVTYGKYGKLIAHQHDLDFALGEQSPLGAMYLLPSYILLIGVGYDCCTGMHLGEYRSNVRDIIVQGGAIEENGYRKWVRYLDLDLDSDEFPEIGKAMEEKGMVTTGTLGNSSCRLMKFAEAVDFTCEYLRKKHG